VNLDPERQVSAWIRFTLLLEVIGKDYSKK